MTCHSCGCPEHALSQKGQTVQIQLEKGYGEKRPRKSTVWTCSEDCALQALACSKYGNQTSKWPVTWPQARTIIRRQGQTAKAASEKKPAPGAPAATTETGTAPRLAGPAVVGPAGSATSDFTPTLPVVDGGVAPSSKPE